MAEVASFGNIVNSLLTLRQNYQEQLKSIPQYEAYLLVQSSTEKAAGALHGSAGSATSIAAEVIDSLQFARNRFEQHLSSVPEYRALLAIDKLINEISLDLGITKPVSESAAKLPEAAFEAAPATLSESGAPIEAELDAAVLAAETAPEEFEAPVQTAAESSVHASVMPIDLDSEPLGDDDIVPVEMSHPETQLTEDENLLEIAYRDVAKAAAESAHADSTPEQAPAIPPQPKMFDGDTDEAAA
jgi:hypothetical protein